MFPILVAAFNSGENIIAATIGRSFVSFLILALAGQIVFPALLGFLHKVSLYPKLIRLNVDVVIEEK